MIIISFFMVILYRGVFLHFIQNIIAILVYPLGTKAWYSFKILWFIRPPLVEIESMEQLRLKSPFPLRFTTYDTIVSSMETGDIIIFIGKNYNRDYVSAKWSYGSPVTHMGLVARDGNDQLCIFEATAINGVILRPLRDRLETYDSDMIAYRKLRVERTKKMEDNLFAFISETEGTKHDLHTLKGLIEMINSAVDIVIPFTRIELFKNKRSTLERIFCSELIAEAYMRMGLLPDGNLKLYPCSNEYTPPDFSNFTSIKNKESELIKNLRLGAILEEEIFILKDGPDKLSI
jgi:hypothetical protein